MNILVVEDCSVMQTIIKKTLSLIGLPISRLDSAANGVAGLELISEHHYNVILIDINMPQMGGLEMIEKLQDHSSTEYTSVIVVSADQQESKRDFIESKNIDFLPKPFKPEDLKSKIMDVTKRFTNK